MGPHPVPVRITWSNTNLGQTQLDIEDDESHRTIARVRIDHADVGAMLASRGYQPATAQLYPLARPAQGTPEHELWIAALDVAADPPVAPKRAHTQVYVPRIERLRAAVEGVGLSWRKVKEGHSD